MRGAAFSSTAARAPFATRGPHSFCWRLYDDKSRTSRCLGGRGGALEAPGRGTGRSLTGRNQECVTEGRQSQLIPFGSFVVRERKKREGRNPKTGAKLVIPARRVPAFSAGKGSARRRRRHEEEGRRKEALIGPLFASNRNRGVALFSGASRVTRLILGIKSRSASREQRRYDRDFRTRIGRSLRSGGARPLGSLGTIAGFALKRWPASETFPGFGLAAWPRNARAPARSQCRSADAPPSLDGKRRNGDLRVRDAGRRDASAHFVPCARPAGRALHRVAHARCGRTVRRMAARRLRSRTAHRTEFIRPSAACAAASSTRVARNRATNSRSSTSKTFPR